MSLKQIVSVILLKKKVLAILTDKELDDTVEYDMVSVSVDEHVGDESPDLLSPRRIIDQR